MSSLGMNFAIRFLHYIHPITRNKVTYWKPPRSTSYSKSLTSCVRWKEVFENYVLATNVCIDESIIKFKGRSSLKQYLPSKPIKRGYKVWCLADSSTGYLFNFDIYNTGEQENREGSLGEHVVLHLANELNLEHHQLFFHNFLTILPFLLQLQEKRIGATGTIRRNRKFVHKELLHGDKSKRGEYRSYACDQVSVVKWQDKKTVSIVSNLINSRQTETCHRKRKEWLKNIYSVPRSGLLIQWVYARRGFVWSTNRSLFSWQQVSTELHPNISLPSSNSSVECICLLQRLPWEKCDLGWISLFCINLTNKWSKLSKEEKQVSASIPWKGKNSTNIDQ